MHQRTRLRDSGFATRGIGVQFDLCGYVLQANDDSLNRPAHRFEFVHVGANALFQPAS
jgi:hypothetical protein